MLASEFPPGPGGIGTHAYQLALCLQRRGWEMAVVTPQAYAPQARVREFDAQQPFRIIPAFAGHARWREAWQRLCLTLRLAGTFHPEILVGTGLSGVEVAAAVGWLRHLPAVAVAHGSEFGAGARRYPWVSRQGFERMAAVVAVSHFTRGVLTQAGIHPRRLEVIPNAADPQRYRLLSPPDCQSFRQATGLGGGPLLLTVGQVSERKGQEVVIRALPAILQRIPQVHYLMIGLPTLQAPLTHLAQRLKVQHHVHFLGVVSDSDLTRWLNSADLFVMTSRTTAKGDCEGFGIAVVEAALCGKPAVVSDQSGLVEAIQPDVTGLAVPADDAQATAVAIISLLSDPQRRMAMGHAALARARREQTWESCGARYDALLREIVGAKSAA